MKARTTSTILAVAGAVASTAFAAVPVIDTSSVSVRQDGSHTVVIDYTMNPATSGDTEPAIVTVDVLTNGVSVGGEHLRTLSGDVNKVVAHTGDYKHKILWSPHKEGMPEFLLPAAQVTAQVTVWSTNSPPDYWVLDLTQPTDRTADRYYPNAGQLPGSVTNILYKTDRLVMRRIPAKGVTWKMGNVESAKDVSALHYVTLSYDYYMAIYETTQAQALRMVPTASAQSSGTIGDAKPYTQFGGNGRYSNLRMASSNSAGWPIQGHEVDSTKFIGKCRIGLGGIMIDLPTEAEWEFACRAGSSTKYCNGDTTADLDKVAWYGGTQGDWHDVGLKDANNWGLYDMHGNVDEWCLDYYSYKTASPVWDPTGPTRANVENPNNPSGSYYYIHAMRGGSIGTAEVACESGRTSNKYNDNENASVRLGCRFCIIIP